VLRVIAAAVFDLAADAVLVAHRLSKLDANLVTTLARLHVNNLARGSNLEVGRTREKKGDVPSASSSRWPLLRGGADSFLGSGYATSACGTQLRRGPPAALPGAGVKQEKKNSAGFQRRRGNITGFICTVAS
jgi:hypothetical protein